MSVKILIFVSCGQRTNTERALGQRFERLVNATPGFHAYYAESVQSLDALANNIFANLELCSGLIALLHNRGSVSEVGGGTATITSSMWINQEIAILAFRQYLETKKFPILIFKEKAVSLEGALASLIANPIEFETEAQVCTKIQHWLQTETFPPSSSEKLEEFEKKKQSLSKTDWQVIECLFALGETNITEAEVKNRLRTCYAMDKAQASGSLQGAKTQFAVTNLVVLQGRGPTGSTMSINPNWNWLLRRELNKRSY